MPSQLTIYHTVHHIYHAITPKLCVFVGGGCRRLQETPSHNRGKMGTAQEFLCGFQHVKPNEMMRSSEYVTKKIKEHNVTPPHTHHHHHHHPPELLFRMCIQVLLGKYSHVRHVLKPSSLISHIKLCNSSLLVTTM